VWERYFPAGTHTLDTTYAAYQFFTPAPNTLPGSDQPADLESAAYIETPAPTVYATPTINVSSVGYGAGLTPYDFGSSVDFWRPGLSLRYLSDRGWMTQGSIATDANPLPSWAWGALGLLTVGRGYTTVDDDVEFTADGPVVVRLYNTRDNRYWTPRPDMSSWRMRVDLEWCNTWFDCRYFNVWERYFPAGTHTLDTTYAAYQFFTPAPNTLPGSDQPADLESAAYIETPAPTVYATPTINVSSVGYGAGLTPYDFGSSVDFWRPGLSLRYLSDRGWMTQGSIATDTNPLPYWAEGALGLLTVGRGYTTVDDDVEFTADAPVVVRVYNTRDNRDWTPLPDMSSWRKRVDLEWCNAWLHCSYSNVWERYFPAGTHTLDTTYAAYQFFTPAPNTLPGSDQPADLESAAYIETPAPTVYATPTINVSIDFEVSPWHSTVMVDSRYVSTGSWAEGALGLLNVSVGIVAFTSDAPVVVRLYNMRDNRYWTPRPDMSSWRKRDDLEWCDVLVCNGPNYYYDVWERCFPAGTHTLDTTESAYQFFTPAPNTLPGSDQPAELESAAAS
jgi:hypothetical protein